MKILPRLFYLAAFLGMAAAAALALDRALDPSMATVLIRAVLTGGVLGAAGLMHRKAWGVSLVLLPVGAYLLLHTIVPPGSGVHGIGGVYNFYLEALHKGADEYGARYFPLNLTDAPELRLLLATIVYLLTGAASFLALSLRRPVPSVALTLLLVGFSFTVDTLPRVIVLALVFMVLAACVLVLSRGLERRAWRVRDAVPGILVGGAGAALALLLLGAAPSAAATPWEDWREWNPFGGTGGSVYSFNWLQDYPKFLDPANNVVIMRVDSSKPSYWRANALDEFNGDAWISSQTFTVQQRVDQTRQGSSYVYTIPAADPTPAGTTVTERFQVRGVQTPYFFAGGDPRALTLGQDVDLRVNEMRALHVAQGLGPSLDYTLKAVIPMITPESLVGLGRDYPAGLESYLALPFPRLAEMRATATASAADKEAAWREAAIAASPGGEQWQNLYTLNAEILGDATDPYEIALRLEEYLRANYQYSLYPPASDFSSPYAAFLFDTHTGYCQHFSGAMALLLRFNGIPARVAVGFTQGEEESVGVYSVSTNNAHAWVEAYFPTLGWVTFDPTPGRSVPTPGGSSTSPGFTDPFSSSSSNSTPGGTTVAPRKQLQDPTGPTGSAAGTGGASWISRLPWLPWLLAIVILLAAWPVGLRLWRERGLRYGGMGRRFAASLRLVRADLATYGVAATGSSTLEEVLDFIDGHLGLQCDPVLAARAGAVLFGGRPPRPEDVRQAEEFRKEVRTALRRRYGWVRTVLVWYGARRTPVPKKTSPCYSPNRSLSYN